MRCVLLLLIGVILTSCSGYQYVACPQFVPLNDKKGELKANVSLNSFQIGYSFHDNFSVFTTGFYRNKVSTFNFEMAGSKENSGAHVRSDNMHDINFGISYFNKIKYINYEILTGFGLGHIEYENVVDLWPDYSFNMTANIQNLFIQPNLGYKVGHVLEVGVFSRFIYSNYYNLATTTELGASSTPEIEDEYFQGKNKANLYFVEPGISVKVGFKNVKFSTQLSQSINLSEEDLRYKELYLRLGVFIDFDLSGL